MTPAQLMACTGCTMDKAGEWLEPLNVAMQHYGITSRQQQAAFLAQCSLECAKFTQLSENFNYSVGGLLGTFNNARVTRFTAEDAYKYARTAQHGADQHMIANMAYANRMGNGNVASNDGWKYRGRGPGQITGKDNYARCGAGIGLDLITHPELLEKPAIGALAFAWFWTHGNPTGKSLNLLADVGDYTGISRAINGGNNGLADRLALTNTGLAALA